MLFNILIFTMHKNKKVIYILVSVIAILGVVVSVFILNSNQIFSAFGLTKNPPIFMFNEQKAPGWWAAENYNSKASTDAKKYQGNEPIDKLPVASMNVFKGKQGEYATACFVLFSYYDYKADTNELSANKEREVAASNSMKFAGETTTSMSILGSAKGVTLRNYELIGPDAENAMKGMSYGWIDLDDGYISINGVCPTANELNNTASIFNGITLVKQ